MGKLIEFVWPYYQYAQLFSSSIVQLTCSIYSCSSQNLVRLQPADQSGQTERGSRARNASYTSSCALTREAERSYRMCNHHLTWAIYSVSRLIVIICYQFVLVIHGVAGCFTPIESWRSTATAIFALVKINRSENLLETHFQHCSRTCWTPI